MGDTKTLNWSKEETNFLLSAFFYGYVVMQVKVQSKLVKYTMCAQMKVGKV